MHSAAILLLNKSGLSADKAGELFEQYLEDLDEHSITTALEKLKEALDDNNK